MTAAPEPLPRDPEFRCAAWTFAQDVDPIGSTPRFDALILVEWPLPWPKDVSDIPELGAIEVDPGTRLMTVVPAEGADSDRVRVTHRRRTGLNHLPGVDHEVPISEVVALVAALAADPQADSSGLPSAVGQAPPEVLVCAHGRRDPCCGRWGTLLELELSSLVDDIRVSRCSHTGGHRYAPTAITLPDGRAWAYAEPELLAGVVSRTAAVADLAPHDRGTSGLDPWVQVLERAVFEQVGWEWLEVAEVEAKTVDEPDATRVSLKWPGGSATALVEISRQLPVLVCGEPPETAKKTSPEFQLTDLHLDL